jgi:hypothetical protein
MRQRRRGAYAGEVDVTLPFYRMRKCVREHMQCNNSRFLLRQDSAVLGQNWNLVSMPFPKIPSGKGRVVFPSICCCIVVTLDMIGRATTVRTATLLRSELRRRHFIRREIQCRLMARKFAQLFELSSLQSTSL